mgnify:CR=1 FL=1
MENKHKVLSAKDPNWRSEVLDSFTKYDYQTSLDKAIAYLKKLPQRTDINEAITESDYVTIYYTIAASAYGILNKSKTLDTQIWAHFFSYFDRYIELIKTANKTSLYPKNAETLLDYALDLLINFQPEQLSEKAKKCVSQMLNAWNEQLALSVLLKKVFDERMDFKHPDAMIYTRKLAEIYLHTAKGYGEFYHAERAAVMNLLSDLTYFEGTENSEEEALQWIEQSLVLNPKDEFAKRRKKNIQDSLTIKEQIRRFNHDTNNELGGLQTNLQELKKRIHATKSDAQTLSFLQKIDNSIQRMAGIRRFVQKQAPEFQQIDIVNQLIIPLNASYQNRMTIQVLPETVCTWEVDRDYLLLALDNLIKNSLEAFERKNIELTQRYLNIKLQITPSHLTIQISDNAGGLDEKLRDHIFEKYISSKGIKKETGLGLSNALNAIEQMGGNLQLAPEQPKNGTTFIIKLTQ